MPFNAQLHVDALLSNVSVKYSNNDFIAMKVFPEVQVKKSSDLYRIYDRDFKIPATLRANKGVANTTYFEVSTASYILQDHALKDYISQEDMDNYDLADLRADTTIDLTDKLLRRVEKSVADLFVKTNWSLTVSLSSGNAFSANTTTSNPIPIFDTAATTIINNTGVGPNFSIIPRISLVNIKNHVSVLDRVKYTSAEVTPVMLGALLGAGEVLSPNSSYDTTGKGAAASITPVWGDYCFLGWKPSNPGPKTPSCGYIFRKSVPMVRRWFDEERNCEAIEVQMMYQPKIVASLCGYLITGVQ